MKHRFGTAVKFLDPDDIEEKLVKRLGRLHTRQRLGIEMDHEALRKPGQPLHQESPLAQGRGSKRLLLNQLQDQQ